MSYYSSDLYRKLYYLIVKLYESLLGIMKCFDFQLILQIPVQNFNFIITLELLKLIIL